jgi:hypothetical protein
MITPQGTRLRGWYLAFHMNGDAALPIAYPTSTIAFVVIPAHLVS